MIRPLFLLLSAAGLAPAQVRQGGAYQITAGILDSGGGLSAAGPYSFRQSFPALGSPASGGVYALTAGFTAQLGGSGGTGSGPAAFLVWQNALFGGPSEPGAGTFDDTDRDGIPNLLEFAFNLSPFISATPLAEPGTTGGLPLIREELFGPDRYITMEFIQRKNAGTFQPQVSGTLASWAPATSSVLSGPDPVTPVYERVKLRLGPPLQSGSPVFYRLAVLIQ